MKHIPYSETIKDNTPKITIYDAMMGSGKSTKVIDLIKESDTAQKYIYITPILSECHRVAGTTYSEADEYKRPTILDTATGTYEYQANAVLASRNFRHPYFSRLGGKAQSLPKLIQNKENVVSTHALFTNLNQDILKGVGDYVLIIDEAIKVYEEYQELDEDHLKKALKNGWISLEEDGITLQFNRDNFALSQDDAETDVTEGTFYEHFATLCDLRQLSLIDNKAVVWQLPIELLRAFKEVIICTYLFEGSLMSSYLKAHNLEYKIEKFGKKPSDIKHLINIYDSKRKGNLNVIGDKDKALCVSDFRKNKKVLTKELHKSLDSFFRGTCKAKQGERLWTTFKPYLDTVGTVRYSDEWLACNTKATNDYGHISNVAYLVNLYPNPMLIKATSKRGHSINQEVYALSDMVQFIWRSAIRNGEPINLYIPSSRMRSLLQKWLSDEFETE